MAVASVRSISERMLCRNPLELIMLSEINSISEWSPILLCICARSHFGSLCSLVYTRSIFFLCFPGPPLFGQFLLWLLLCFVYLTHPHLLLLISLLLFLLPPPKFKPTRLLVYHHHHQVICSHSKWKLNSFICFFSIQLGDVQSCNYMLYISADLIFSKN